MKIFSTLVGDTCIITLYLWFYLSEEFSPNSCGVRLPKKNGTMHEHKNEHLKGNWWVTTLIFTTQHYIATSYDT